MKIRRKRINIVYRVGNPPTDAHTPTEDGPIGANQDSQQNALVHDVSCGSFFFEKDNLKKIVEIRTILCSHM